MPCTVVGEVAYYDVVKVHHTKGWLRQRRLLIMTPTHVMKCHPTADALPGDPYTLLPTKVHLLSSLEYVALKSQRSFMLKFRGDHAYFYKSPDALEVVHRVQLRVAALRAAKILQPNGCDMLRALEAGEVHLPEEEDVRALLPVVIDIKRAVHAGAFDGSGDVAAIQRRFLGDGPVPSGPEVSVAGSLRSALTDLRERFVQQLVTGRRTFMSRLASTLRDRALPVCDDECDATLAVEVALQQLVVTQVFRVVWADVGRTFADEQARYDANCVTLRARPLMSFGTHPHFEPVKFDLVREHLRSLQRCHNATELLNTIYAAVKSVVACVEAHHSSARTVASAAVEAAETILHRVSSPRLHGPRPAHSTTASPTGDDTEVELGDAVVAAAELRLADTQRALDDLPGHAEYTTDDVLPVFIYILVWCRVPGVALFRRFVDFVGDTNESTERAYYFTVFASAVEYIATAEAESTADGTPQSPFTDDPPVAADPVT